MEVLPFISILALHLDRWPRTVKLGFLLMSSFVLCRELRDYVPVRVFQIQIPLIFGKHVAGLGLEIVMGDCLLIPATKKLLFKRRPVL